MEHSEHLYETIYNRLLERINSGEIKKGERLPSEKELTQAFGVSRITTQKAMNMLAEQGIIVRHPRLGSFVKEDKELSEAAEMKKTEEAGDTAAYKKLIGLVMEDFTDSYGIELLRAIENESRQLGYHLCIKRSMGSQDTEKEAIDQLMELGAAGILIMPTHGDHYNTQILKLVVDGYPVVFVDCYLDKIPASYVGTNNKKAAEELTDYLIEMGHRKIAVISAPAAAAVTLSDRMEGFEAACNKSGISIEEGFIIDDIRSTMPNYRSLENTGQDMEGIEKFLKQHDNVTAVFATEYLIADMVKSVCRKIGKRVPEDISIACFDGPASLYRNAFFTHMRQDEQRIGAAAVRKLNELLCKQEQGASTQIYLDAELIQGDSVRKI